MLSKTRADGVISLADLERALTKDTVLVSIMLVNNETGSIQPVKEAAKIVKNLSPHAIVHCDAVQAYGKLPINVHDLSVDLFSASGHKIQGPKGVGFLYCKKGLRLPPLLEGGGQENGFRSGTEPVPLICGLQGAVEELPDTAKQLSIQQELFDYAKQRLLETGLVKMNSPDGCLPYILNFSMPGYRSEILLHFLEQREIYVSSGSACARGHGSYVLAEMGFDSRRQDSALRISFSKDNKIEEVDTLIDALIDAAGRLRKV